MSDFKFSNDFGMRAMMSLSVGRFYTRKEKKFAARSKETIIVLAVS